MTEMLVSPEIAANRPKAVIILVRHEESVANANKKRIQGFNPTVPLSEDGGRRAEQTGGPGLGELLDQNGLEIVSAYVSEADRSKQTAQKTLDSAGIEIPLAEDARLNEQGKGDKNKGGVEDMEREFVETAAYKAREQLEDWNFRPGVDDQPGVAESGAETPAEVAGRWLSWRDDITTQIESGALPPTQDSSKIPAIVVFGHNLITAYGMGDERGMSVPESKKHYRIDNGEALVLGWDGAAWNLEGQLYRPAEPVAAHEG